VLDEAIDDGDDDGDGMLKEEEEELMEERSYERGEGMFECMAVVDIREWKRGLEGGRGKLSALGWDESW
jgi:hypothetical protein